MESGAETIIRPAAILSMAQAAVVLRALEQYDVACGGVWSATPGMWQRFDRAWDGIAGTRGTAQLLGSIAVVYDAPRRHEITIFKATVTPAGVAAGWDVDKLCDDALTWAGLTLATCPRAELRATPQPDPFHSGAAYVPDPRAAPACPTGVAG